MESNDNVEREKIESQLNDNWKTAMEQFQYESQCMEVRDVGKLLK